MLLELSVEFPVPAAKINESLTFLNVRNNDFFKAQLFLVKGYLIEIVLLIKFCQDDRM